MRHDPGDLTKPQRGNFVSSIDQVVPICDIFNLVLISNSTTINCTAVNVFFGLLIGCSLNNPKEKNFFRGYSVFPEAPISPTVPRPLFHNIARAYRTISQLYPTGLDRPANSTPVKKLRSSIISPGANSAGSEKDLHHAALS